MTKAFQTLALCLLVSVLLFAPAYGSFRGRALDGASNEAKLNVTNITNTTKEADKKLQGPVLGNQTPANDTNASKESNKSNKTEGKGKETKDGALNEAKLNVTNITDTTKEADRKLQGFVFGDQTPANDTNASKESNKTEGEGKETKDGALNVTNITNTSKEAERKLQGFVFGNQPPANDTNATNASKESNKTEGEGKEAKNESGSARRLQETASNTTPNETNESAAANITNITTGAAATPTNTTTNATTTQPGTQPTTTQPGTQPTSQPTTKSQTPEHKGGEKLAAMTLAIGILAVVSFVI